MRFFGLLGLLLMFSMQALAADRQIPESNQQIMLSYAPLVKKAAPAVVNIYTSHKVQVKLVSPLLQDPFFRQFFGNNIQGLQREREVSSLGSGVIVNPAGLVITNNHVVKDSDQIKIVLSDRREFEAEILVADPTTDLALLKLKTSGGKLPFLPMADSDNIEVGDMVLAVGNPFGVGQTVTSGIISALARTTVGITDYQFFIQTDAAINPGNSGGALIDMNGRLIGVNTAIFSRTGGSNGIGFAIPSNMVATILSGQNGGGKIIRPWMGASFQQVTPDVATAMGLDTPKGALIKEIYPQGPAARAGLSIGDVVLKFDDKEITDAPTLKFRIATSAIGKPANLQVLRAGQLYSFTLPMEAPPETPRRNATRIEGNNPLQGATAANLSPALANEMGFHQFSGVVLTDVQPQGKAGIIGFKREDMILAINNRKITSVDELRAALAEPVRNWLVTFRRGEKTIEVTLAR